MKVLVFLFAVLFVTVLIGQIDGKRWGSSGSSSRSSSSSRGSSSSSSRRTSSGIFSKKKATTSSPNKPYPTQKTQYVANPNPYPTQKTPYVANPNPYPTQKTPYVANPNPYPQQSGSNPYAQQPAYNPNYKPAPNQNPYNPAPNQNPYYPAPNQNPYNPVPNQNSYKPPPYPSQTYPSSNQGSTWNGYKNPSYPSQTGQSGGYRPNNYPSQQGGYRPNNYPSQQGGFQSSSYPSQQGGFQSSSYPKQNSFLGGVFGGSKSYGGGNNYGGGQSYWGPNTGYKKGGNNFFGFDMNKFSGNKGYGGAGGFPKHKSGGMKGLGGSLVGALVQYKLARKFGGGFGGRGIGGFGGGGFGRGPGIGKTIVTAAAGVGVAYLAMKALRMAVPSPDFGNYVLNDPRRLLQSEYKVVNIYIINGTTVYTNETEPVKGSEIPGLDISQINATNFLDNNTLSVDLNGTDLVFDLGNTDSNFTDLIDIMGEYIEVSNLTEANEFTKTEVLTAEQQLAREAGIEPAELGLGPWFTEDNKDKPVDTDILMMTFCSVINPFCAYMSKNDATEKCCQSTKLCCK